MFAIEALNGLFEVQPELQELENTLIELGVEVSIEFTDDFMSSFDPNSNTVSWNASDLNFTTGTTADRLSSGKDFTAGVIKITPLEILVHELGHAYDKYDGDGIDHTMTIGVENSRSRAGAERLKTAEQFAIEFTNRFRERTGRIERRLTYGGSRTARGCRRSCPGANSQWKNGN